MKTVIEMARESDFCVSDEGEISTNNSYGILQGELDKFAELVRAEERKSICKLIEHSVDLAGIFSSPQLQNYTATLLKNLAECIRARGNT